MTDRPYVILSCAASIDGYIDDVTDTRLMLSNAADFDRVDEVRSRSDAILVGSNTIRRDNPRLMVRSPERREARAARDLAPTPIKVTLTGQGGLDPEAQFFTAGDSGKFVYASADAVNRIREEIGDVAAVISASNGFDPTVVDLRRMLEDLGARGVDVLMVEGGGGTHTQFLAAGLADELHLVVAPLFVGDSRAPSFVRDGSFPWNGERRASLAEVTQIGDCVLLRYGLSSRFSAR
jgi:5-amino-6-(5-phosphoribosylamino)uracil reductase